MIWGKAAAWLRLPGLLFKSAINMKKKGKVKISNSINEIARWMGAPPQKIKATIDQYNADCGRGYDTKFLKDRRYLDALHTPPYYAVKFQQTLLDTAGGIKTNSRMEIIAACRDLIPPR